jgi:hypothetical protein
MGAHADILRSLLIEMDRFDRRVGSLIRLNRARIVLSRDWVDACDKQMAEYDSSDPDAPSKSKRNVRTLHNRH